ncbi:MFS transporter [Phytohabitans sp. ZYX-F-186]|uniref:MFS transporter n=1 Tax=Phytohabitans maris TaxID=3071409 RepID=A0ABU0ZKS9_9ACTN|nr:MFS transporter [Phytohabitans sp. ZYX-F-186]MDQ7906992.1 MFS transporter [Phytohabitans sp. ZYX-F-186]
MSQATLTRPGGPNTDLRRPSRRGHGHPWLTLLAVALGVMVVGLDATVVAIANPAIARDLGADFAQLQWVTNGYLLALAVSLIVAGRLADRFGRKTVFLVGVAGFAIASVAVGLSGSIEMVIFWRVMQGFAGALLQPASLAILRNTFPAEKLNMAIGIWAGTSGLAIASGPIVAGLLVENASWEWVFFLNGPVAAVAILLGLWVVRQSRDPEAAGSFDLPGVGLLSAALFSLVWGLIKAQEYGFGDIVPLGFFAGAAVLGTAFILRERWAAHPLMPLGLFRDRSFSAGTGLAMLGFFALFGSFFFLTLYLQQVHGMSPVDAGVRLLPMTATFIVASPVAGALTARFGPRPPLVIGMLLTSVALFALSRIGVQADYLSLWPWFIVIGMGFGMVLVGSTEAIVGNAPVHLAGLAGGIQQTAAQLGGVLGTTVFGTILATRVGDVLVEKLTGAGVPAEMAPGFTAAEDYVAQGVAPVPPGAPQPLADAITTGSHLAFMTGFQGALTVGAAIALLAAVAALLVRRGENTTAGAHAGV